MKKAICLLVAMILSLSICCAASGETFTIHNGTTFGMSKSEVKSTESSAGNLVESNVEVSVFKSCPVHSKNNLSINCTVVGYKGANILYEFDKSDKLETALYFLTWGKSKNSCLSDYYSITEALTSKYGAPDSAAKLMIENGHLPCCAIKMAAHQSNDSTKYYFSNCEVFSFNQDNGDVVLIYVGLLDSSVLNNFLVEALYINYQAYSAADYEAAMTKVTNETTQAFDDL